MPINLKQMNSFIQTLREKEKELAKELESLPLFKQLEGIRSTIHLFQNGSSYKETPMVADAVTVVPEEYNDETMTWNQKILFALQGIKEGFVPNIVKELKRLGCPETDEFLMKRVSVTASNLKKEKLIKSVSYGKKVKYFIK